jgi:hypothetical protein
MALRFPPAILAGALLFISVAAFAQEKDAAAVHDRILVLGSGPIDLR